MENILVPYQATRTISALQVLVLAPHPDDEVFGCGGAIMRHVEVGIPVRVIILSDGAFGLEGNNRTEFFRQRQRESIQAALILGYGVPEFWGERDREILYGEKLVLRILEAIQDADLIYAPSVFEMHPDHRALGMATVEAVRRRGNDVRLALYEVGMPLRPNLLLDISAVAGRKMAAMQCFVSQNQKQRYDLDIAALNRYRTYTLAPEVTAAEAFILASSSELASDPLKLYQSEHARQQDLCLAMDAKDMPLVSIVIRSMDRATLDDALDSIALQTYAHIEVLVVNAKGVGHRDIAAWCGRFPARLIGNGKRLARSFAGNMGLGAAQGEHIMFLDDDDWIEPDHVQKLSEAIARHPEFSVAYTGVKCVDSVKNPLPKIFADEFNSSRMLAGNFIPIHAVLFSRKLIGQDCRLDESLDLYEDWDFWLQLSRHCDFLKVEGLSAVYRITQQSGFGVNADPVMVEVARRVIHRKWFDRLGDHQIARLMETILQQAGTSQALSGLDPVEVQRQLNSLNETLTDLNQTITDRNQTITDLNQTVTDRDRWISDLEQSASAQQILANDLNGKIAHLNHLVADRDGQIAHIFSSNSWKITRPLRLLSRLLSGKRPLVANGLRARLLHHGKSIYYRLPPRYRTPVLHWGYRNLGPLFKGMPHFEQWKTAPIPFTGTSGGDLLLIDALPLASQAEGRIAVHLHMYYLDLADEFCQYLKNMPFDYDLFVSVSSAEGLQTCTKAFSGLPKQRQLVIEQVANHGRDIAPMFCTFGERLKNYDFVAHLHSKKSLYNNGATEGWRQYLCENLFGSPERIRRIFALMQSEKPCGIVYPQNFIALPYQANTWLANKAMGAAWCARLGISTIPQGYFDFPAGSMFWARCDALQPLFDAEIKLSDFAEESGQTDGTFAHCLERLLVLSSLNQGMGPGIIKDLQQPRWSAWGFQQYATRPFQYMADQLSAPDIKLIAFDIFDTLLSRPLLDAESVKALVAERVGGNVGQFYMQYRSIAEGQARERAGVDIGMTEIFVRLGELTALPKETLLQLRMCEEEIEQASVTPRPDVVELYHRARATGKPVVLVSDMFLPRALIEDCLQNNGISGWSVLFLSNEIGLRKDNGKLYEHIFSHFGIHPQEMLMVGDNERSDVQIPCDKGGRSLHVLKPLEFARGLPRWRSLVEEFERLGDLNDELTLGLIVRRNFSAISYPQLDPAALLQATPFNFGYSLIGPLLVGLSDWLIEHARRDEIDRLYFLAREGQLLKYVYDVWSEGLEDLPQSEYLVVSRRAVSVSAIKGLDDILKIAKATYFQNTVENFLHERYGLNLSTDRWAQITNELQWQRNSKVEVLHKNTDHLLSLLGALESDIVAVASHEHDDLMTYLTKMKLDDIGRQAVVDIGYGGTIQDYLNRLVSIPVHGYYMITDERAQNVSHQHDVLIRGCYLENVEHNASAPQMYLHSFELEKLLSSSDAQIVRYERDGKNNLTARYRELSGDEISSARFRAELQEGVISYARDAKYIREKILPSFKPSQAVAMRLYECFITQQSQLETKMMQKVALDDHYCGRGIVR